jgi:hypothetical protein
MAKSGKKQELIDRIVDVLDQWRRQIMRIGGQRRGRLLRKLGIWDSELFAPFSLSSFLFCNACGWVPPNLINLVWLFCSGTFPPNRVGVGTSQSVSVSHVTYDPPKPNLYSPVSGQNSSSSIAHYDPYAPPRRPVPAVNSPVASSSSSAALNNHKLRES